MSTHYVASRLESKQGPHTPLSLLARNLVQSCDKASFINSTIVNFYTTQNVNIDKNEGFINITNQHDCFRKRLGPGLGNSRAEGKGVSLRAPKVS